MDTFLDVTGIVKRAKQVLNFKNDSELAEYLASHAPQYPIGVHEIVLTSACYSINSGTRWTTIGYYWEREIRNTSQDIAKANWCREKSRLYTIRKHPNQ